MPPILLSTVNQCTFIKDRNNNLRRKKSRTSATTIFLPIIFSRKILTQLYNKKKSTSRRWPFVFNL